MIPYFNKRLLITNIIAVMVPGGYQYWIAGMCGKGHEEHRHEIR
jgi:hypothetical protein